MREGTQGRGEGGGGPGGEEEEKRREVVVAVVGSREGKNGGEEGMLVKVRWG